MEQHVRAQGNPRGAGRPDHRGHLHRRNRRDEVGARRLTSAPSIGARVDTFSESTLESSLRERGHARTGPLLNAAECRELTSLFSRDDVFRKRVTMGRHRFGEGDYGYFGEPLPALVSELRESLYAKLAPIAGRWATDLGQTARFPPTLTGWRRRCARGGQPHPTPLLLRYTEGGYNRLHQDLYGELSFPFQATVLLSRPGDDFSGGEFLLVENRPRQQSIGTALALERGEAVIFPVAERPVPGARGTLRATVRHGMSRLDGGERYALGIIFHDAK